MTDAREQIHEMAEKELGKKFEEDLKQAKRENKKKIKTKFKDKTDQPSQRNANLESNSEDIKAKLDQANEENKKKDTEIEELQNKSGAEIKDFMKLSKIISNVDSSIKTEPKIAVDCSIQEDKDALKLLSSNKLPALKRV